MWENEVVFLCVAIMRWCERIDTVFARRTQVAAGEKMKLNKFIQILAWVSNQFANAQIIRDQSTEFVSAFGILRIKKQSPKYLRELD